MSPVSHARMISESQGTMLCGLSVSFGKDDGRPFWKSICAVMTWLNPKGSDRGHRAEIEEQFWFLSVDMMTLDLIPRYFASQFP